VLLFLAFKTIYAMITSIGSPVYTTVTHSLTDQTIQINPCFEECICYLEAIGNISSDRGNDHIEQANLRLAATTNHEDLFTL
jgi:hypothetical protein